MLCRILSLIRSPRTVLVIVLSCWNDEGTRAVASNPVPVSAVQSATEGSTVFESRPIASVQEAQIALARLGFSSGAIDGISGAQTDAALRVFQAQLKLPVTGQLDEATRARLILSTSPLREITLSLEEFKGFGPLATTWMGKSLQTELGYESALEWAAEKGHAQPALIRQLNPTVDWDHVLPGARFMVPAVGPRSFPTKAARLEVQLESRIIRAYDANDTIMVQFPVSIARKVEKRPSGELRVTVVIPNPDYTFDPAVFPESDEGRELGRKLRLPPGPNNPVGRAWVGLDWPGYGIHGSPTPEKVGRTESHGCFRLANWDALTLIELAWVGLPVVVLQ